MNRLADAYDAWVQREAQLAQHHENSGRMAWSYKAFTTEGWGEILHPDVADFQGAYVERPFISYSFFVDGDQFPDQDVSDETPQLPVGSLPRCTGGVHEWVMARGLYVGAYLYVTVDRAYDTTLTDETYEIEHHFTFAARAIKRVPRGNDNMANL